MAKIKIKTNIDITNTGVRRPEPGKDKQVNQCRNYTTFLQVLGLRSIYNVETAPEKDGEFWTFVVDTDRDDVYSDGTDPVGLLKQDLDKVPIITGLDEKKTLKQGLIRTTGTSPNTIVSLLK
jgi:hypothetical protein